MEYLLSYFGSNVREDNRKCMEFMKQHQTLINECLDNKYSEPKEMFTIKNKTEFLDKIEKNFPNKYIKNNVEKLRKNYNLKELSDDFRLLFLRYECFCDKNLILKVSLGEIKGMEKEKVFEIAVNDKMLHMINLQIEFIRRTFDEFKEYLFDNSELFKKYEFQKFSNMKEEKNKKLIIYLGPTVNSGDIFFMSKNFYELVEGSKIFLNYNNYDFFFETDWNFFYKKLGRNIQNIFQNKIF